MRRIIVDFIPHAHQRYDTVGDYGQGATADHIYVSRLPDWRMEALVAVHELVEFVLTRHHGVSLEAIDAFDQAFEGDEPGEDPKAPYHLEHCFAEEIEKLVASQLEVDWEVYTKTIQAVGDK